MNKRIDLSNLGGFPLEQDTLDFMQQSYRGAFGAIAKLCGNKTILYGVEIVGSTVTDGWIAVNGELMPFIGGATAADVVIVETPADTQSAFEDNSERDVYFTKVATVGVGGAFPFADLVPLLSLQNVWRSGDIKERYCDNAYITANFDGDGYGLGVEKGWRILSKAIPTAAGKTFVNLDSTDVDFNTCGNIGGEKKHALTGAENGPHRHTGRTNDRNFGLLGGENYFMFPQILSTTESNSQMGSSGLGTPHNNLQPYFVILKLLKL